MKIKVEFAKPGSKTDTVEGEFVLPDGPFSPFMAVDTGDGHVLFPWDSVVRIDVALEEQYLADLDVVAQSKEMALTNFANEYKRMTNSPGGHFG